MSFKETSFPCSSLVQAARDGLLEELRRLVDEGNLVDIGDNRGWRPLHEAAQANYIDCVKFILQQDECDVNWRSFDGITALNLACMKGLVDIVRILLDAGADPNIGDHVDTYPILNAVRCSSLDCVELLVSHNAKVNVQLYCGTTPLHHAASEGRVDIVEYLLDNGADVSLQEEYAITPLFASAQYGQEECCRKILDKAIALGSRDVIDTCADDGATPVYLASQEGHAGIVKLLLDNGASANRCTENPVALPLHAALQFNHVECVKLLLPHTDLTILDKCDVSAFYFSMTAEDTECTKELLAAGLSPSHRHRVGYAHHYKPTTLRYFQENIKYSKNISPLVELAINRHGLEHARVLINAGASVNAQTSFEAPPLLVALEYKMYDLVKLLIKHGAHVNIYHPKVICNMAVVVSYCNWKGLNMILKYGAEASSMFARTAVCAASLSPVRRRLAELDDALSEPGEEEEEEDYENEVGILHYPIPFWRHLAETRMNNSKITVAQMIRRVLHFVGTVRLDQRLSSYVDSKEEWHQLTSITDFPRSLTHLCRLIIRDKLGPQRLLIPDHIKSLPLPEPVIDFLLYKELES